MKIRPLYVKIKNFASFGNKEVKVDFPGPGESLLIMGPIGSGKSSIFHALFWCITGKKLDNSMTLVNSVNKKNMAVECAWSVPWQEEPLVVQRGMKPAKFKVSGLKGTIQPEIKKEFEKIFPLTDPQVLLNLCLLSVAKSLPFFGLEKKQRLNFLRNFIDTDRLDQLSEKARDIHLSAKRDSDILSRELKVIKDQMDSIQDQINAAKKEASSTVETLPDADRQKVESALTLYTEIQDQCESDRRAFESGEVLAEEDAPSRKYISPAEYVSIRAEIGELGLPEAEADLKKVDTVVNTIRTRIKAAEDSIADAESDSDGIESLECKEYFTAIIEQNKGKLDRLRKDLKQAESMQDTVQSKVDALSSKKDRLQNQLDQAIRTLNTQASQATQMLKKLQAIIAEDDKNRGELAKETAKSGAVESLTQLMQTSSSRYEEKRLELAEAGRTALVSKEYRKILDDTWSFMTARMVPFLNSRLPYYMERLRVNFSMQLDPKDISKPIFKGRPGIGDLKLSDLSTGQKRVLSICLAHALRDMHSAQNAADIGFLLIDELAGNMDSNLVQILMEFEFQYAQDTDSSLVLVTHDVSLQQRSEWTSVLEVDRDVFSRVKVTREG